MAQLIRLGLVCLQKGKETALSPTPGSIALAGVLVYVSVSSVG